MLFTLMARELQPLHVPAALGGMGMALLLVGSLTRYTAIKASGVLSMGLAAAFFYRQLYNAAAPLAQETGFLIYLGLFLVTLAGAERLFALLEQFEAQPSRSEDVLRSILVALAALLGAFGLHEWCVPGDLVFYLLGFAVIAISLGAAFRESRYRWGGLALIALALFRAFTRFGEFPSELHQILTFGAPAIVLLVVSWAYSRGRRKPRGNSPMEGGGSAGRHDD